MKTIVVAPHPDDEVLGVGGTLFRRKKEGAKNGWLIVTCINTQLGWSDYEVQKRADEIKKISVLFEFDSVFQLNFSATQLDKTPISEIVSGISKVFKEFNPEEIFVPHPSDVHTDHRVVFDAVSSCTKWFRYPSVRRILAYETLSETDFGLSSFNGFRPNMFIEITPFLDKKIEAMEIYSSELCEAPFPRSREAISALATLRGAASGFKAAEAFELLRERL